jgi:hypothetical protein
MGIASSGPRLPCVVLTTGDRRLAAAMRFVAAASLLLGWLVELKKARRVLWIWYCKIRDRRRVRRRVLVSGSPGCSLLASWLSTLRSLAMGCWNVGWYRSRVSPKRGRQLRGRCKVEVAGSSQSPRPSCDCSVHDRLSSSHDIDNFRTCRVQVAGRGGTRLYGPWLLLPLLLYGSNISVEPIPRIKPCFRFKIQVSIELVKACLSSCLRL